MRKSTASILMAASAALILANCSFGVSKQEIRQNADHKTGSIVLAKNYQALLKCWDDRADKGSFNSGFAATVTSNVYTELGKAEISITAGGSYLLLIELEKIGQNRTKLMAYGQGDVGQTYIPKWGQTLENCADGTL